MMRVIQAERQKAKRRPDLPLAVFAALIVLLWAKGMGVRTADERATGYSALFYALPLMNTVVMPISMAALASRMWEIESGNLRLILTLHSRRSLFAAKALRGLLLAAVACAVESGGILLLGHMAGFTQALDAAQLAWLTACTFVVSAMLFFAFLLLSVRFSSQVPTLAAGMLGSLLGLFAAFMPKSAAYLMPWAYFIPLTGMSMNWNSETRFATYVPQAFEAPLLGAAFALGVLGALMACRAIEHKEV